MAVLMMECGLFRYPPPTHFSERNKKKEREEVKRRNFRPVARIGGEDTDPFLQAAVRAATLRFHETHRPDPLVIDPYAACFLSTATLHKDMAGQNPTAMDASYPTHYILATKFIDDKLLTTVSGRDELRQVVLLTDGMDTRPFRLRWPHSTLIFDISPEIVFKESSQKLEGIGAKVAKSCMLLHVPFKASYLKETLSKKGFSSDRPSIWAIQGLPLLTREALNEILIVVSSLVMKGCTFIGELPGWLVETEVGNKIMTQKQMDKLFMSNGFRVDVVDYNEVARGVHHASAVKDCNNVLFVAQQLQLSDGQMHRWRTEFQRLEEEGDEEGFEEL